MASEIDPQLRRSIADGRTRCWWCGDDPLYVDYHDREWGVPVRDDVRLFEKVCLEGFQSGLSWITILRKRENFRRAFDGFDPATVARFGDDDVQRLLGDEGIIRHRGKIEAVVNNARCLLRDFAQAGQFSDFVWSFAPDLDPIDVTTVEHLPSRTPESVRLSNELRKRGWKYVGPTTMYAFMQSMGLVNDHLEGCDFRHVGP